MLAQIEAMDQLEQLRRDAEACYERLAGRASPEDIEAAREAYQLLVENAARSKYDEIPAQVRTLNRKHERLGGLVMARALSALKGSCMRRGLPGRISLECARQGRRVLETLDTATPPVASFGDDVFLKDLAIALGSAVPCVARVVDLHSGLPRSLLFGAPSRPRLALLGILLRRGRLAPFLEVHTHTPMLDGFNPAGLRQCYGMIADLLLNDPECLGVIGASWFYDPVVAKISPRLAYVRDIPASGNAVFIARSATQTDAMLATAASPTRRRLFEAGEYVPTAYVMIWRREHLLEWRERSAT